MVSMNNTLESVESHIESATDNSKQSFEELAESLKQTRELLLQYTASVDVVITSLSESFCSGLERIEAICNTSSGNGKRNAGRNAKYYTFFSTNIPTESDSNISN